VCFKNRFKTFKRRRISNICRLPIPQIGGCNTKRTITIWLEPRHWHVLHLIYSNHNDKVDQMIRLYGDVIRLLKLNLSFVIFTIFTFVVVWSIYLWLAIIVIHIFHNILILRYIKQILFPALSVKDKFVVFRKASHEIKKFFWKDRYQLIPKYIKKNCCIKIYLK